MNKLWILIKVLVLVATLAGLGAEPVARADEVVTGAGGESALERRMQDADFLRHNTGTHSWVAQSDETFKRDADFLRHNYGTHSWVVQVAVVAQSEASLKQRTRDTDFLRHNYGAHPWEVQATVDVIK